MEKSKVIAIRKKIGKDIKREREARNLSLWKASTNSGIRINVAKSIEDGSKSYTIDSLLIYAKYFGIEIKNVPEIQADIK